MPKVSLDSRFAEKNPMFFLLNTVVRCVYPDLTRRDLTFGVPFFFPRVAQFKYHKSDGQNLIERTCSGKDGKSRIDNFLISEDVGISIGLFNYQLNPLDRWGIDEIGIPRKPFKANDPILPIPAPEDDYLIFRDILKDIPQEKAGHLRARICAIIKRISEDPIASIESERHDLRDEVFRLRAQADLLKKKAFFL